jgi:hypothetical protein
MLFKRADDSDRRIVIGDYDRVDVRMSREDVGDHGRRRGAAPSARPAGGEFNAGVFLEHQIEPVATFRFDRIAENAFNIDDFALAPSFSKTCTVRACVAVTFAGA